eukprot:526849_1
MCTDPGIKKQIVSFLHTVEYEMTTIVKNDSNLFKQIDDKCDTESDDLLNTCDVMKRLIYGLQYYTSLDVKNQYENKDEFNNFICKVYYKFLDDYTHLINIHAHKLQD